jgi:hypothetical protein
MISLLIAITVNVQLLNYAGPDSVDSLTLQNVFSLTQTIFERDTKVKLKLKKIIDLPDPSLHLEDTRQKRFKFLWKKSKKYRKRRRITIAVTGPIHADDGSWICAGRAWIGGYYSKYSFGWATVKGATYSTPEEGDIDFIVNITNLQLSAQVLAHEIGHVLNAPHKGHLQSTLYPPGCTVQSCSILSPQTPNIMHPALLGWDTQGLGLQFLPKSAVKMKRYTKRQKNL